MSVPSCAVWHVFLHRPANELGVHRQWKLSNQVNVIPLLASLLAERRSATCAPPLVRAKCDAGEKGLECARNCQNADHPCVSLACVPGCLCPPGTVGCGSFMHAIYTVFSLLILFFILIVSIYCWLIFQVSHHGDCIVPDQCPCYHNNKPYASGQSIPVDCNTW